LAQGIVLENCPYVIPSSDCTRVAVDADGGFCMESIQGDHGEVTWSIDGRSPRATLWTSLSEVANLNVGTVLLVLPETVAQVGTPAGFDVDLTKGIVFAAVMDCGLLGAKGVRFVAHSTQSQARTGVSFMFVGLTPKDAPTNEQGLGGIVNVEPGLVTVDAVLPDGCIVGQADVLADRGTVTYVYLVPNGARDLADGGADQDADASLDGAGNVTDGRAGAVD
jgi:hypothetical protein